jgi:hypothetical protein
VRFAIGLAALVALMGVYLPFFMVGIFCDAVGKHAVDLCERIDGWMNE